MRSWKKYCGSLALLMGLAPGAVKAQIPGAGAAAAPAAAAPAAAVPGVASPAAAAPAAAAPQNIFSMLCMTPEQKAACREKICNSGLGKMLNASLQPMAAFTGGLFGPFCPVIETADLLKPPTSAEGAAARIQADEAAAKERRAAVRYLGTVDCRYWPEAQEALINALRADRNECVRLEAALSLGRGCCCTKNVIVALALTVSSSDADGNPRECSERVKAAAQYALEHCLMCYSEVVPAPPPKPIKKEDRREQPREEPGEPRKLDEASPTSAGKATSQLDYTTDFYRRAKMLPTDTVVSEARRALGKVRPVSSASDAASDSQQPRKDRSVTGLLRRAFGQESSTPEPTVVDRSSVRPTAHRVSTPQAPGQPMPAQAPVVQPASTPTARPVPHHPAAGTPTAAAGQNVPTVAQLLYVMQASPDFRQRAGAADMLSAYDGWGNPQIVQALVGSAHRDESPWVRSSCLNSLARMNVRTVPVLTIVQALKADPDPQVRAAAEQALLRLGGSNLSYNGQTR